MPNDNQPKQGKEKKPYPIFLTRCVAGMTIVTGISHWSNEEPPAEFVELLNRRSRDYQRRLALRVGRERDAGKESSVTAYRCGQCGHEWLGSLYKVSGSQWCGECKSTDWEEVGIEAVQSLIATLASSPREGFHGSAR